MILVIDNYDSFTYNLVQYLGELGTQPLVRRNNEVTLDEIAALQARAHRDFAGPGPARAGRHHAGRHQAVRPDDAAAGRVPRTSGDRHGVRRSRRSSDRADARQDVEHHARRPGRVRRHRDARSPSRAITRWSSIGDGWPDGPGDYGADRRRRHRDGAAASHASRFTACSSILSRS